MTAAQPHQHDRTVFRRNGAVEAQLEGKKKRQPGAATIQEQLSDAVEKQSGYATVKARTAAQESIALPGNEVILGRFSDFGSKR